MEGQEMKSVLLWDSERKKEANTHNIRVFREERVPSMVNYLESFRERLNQSLTTD